MASRRVIQAALHNFLGTYASRYSGFEGYWLFGFLVSAIDRVDFDLLREPSTSGDRSPLSIAAELAVRKFREQARKAGVLGWVADAELTIARTPGAGVLWVNGREQEGYPLRLIASAASDRGVKYHEERRILVAPHDPRAERRSASA